MKKRISVGFLMVAVIAAFAAAGCAPKEEPLTEKLPPKVERANGPTAGGMAAPASGAAVAKPTAN